MKMEHDVAGDVAVSPDMQSIGAWFVLFVVGMVFTFIINTIFGHPTYHSIERQDLLASRKNQQRRETRPNHTSSGNNGKGVQIFHKTRELPEAVLLHTYSYLNAHEILQLIQTGKSSQRFADQSELWTNLIQLCAKHASCGVTKQAQSEIHALCSSTASTKRGFFEAVHHLAPILATSFKQKQNEDMFIIVHRRVYRLTYFVNEHPGGALIIQSYNGKDATKMYDRALHSKVAKEQAKDFVVWDPAEYIGAESGVPAFAKDAVVSGADGWLEAKNHHIQP